MRVLWLSPWMRPLARVHAAALAARGHEVLLVTADQHPEPTTPLPHELVLRPRPKDPSTWAPLPAARRRVAGFAPDVVVSELVRDPRWTLLAPGVPRVTVVHDDRPHDAGEERPRWERALFDRWARSGDLTVAFSDHVAGHLPAVGLPPVRVVPLTSDLPDGAVPPPVAADGRRDVVLVGRIAGYKNLEVALRAWREHVAGPGWRGDELVVIGAGEVPDPGVPSVRHRAGSFAYADVIDELARAKGSLVHYRRASQSGAQVLSMQLGVATIVSPEGALPDYQAPGAPVVGVDDVAGLRAAFDLVADPVQADRLGRAARARYVERHAADRAGQAWERVLEEAASARSRRRPPAVARRARASPGTPAGAPSSDAVGEVSARVVVDGWYATGLAPHLAGPVTTVDDVVGDRFPRAGRLLLRSGPTRGLALVAATRPTDTVVMPDASPGSRWVIGLGAVLGRRNLVLLEYIHHAPTGGGAAAAVRRARFTLLRRVLLPRTLAAAQVLTTGEVDRCARSHGIDAGRFRLVPWPARLDATAVLPDRAPAGRRVLCSGRRVDWATFAAAARGSDWQVTAICSAADADEVRDLLSGSDAGVLVEVDLDEHLAQVGAAAVFVVALPETGASIGQVRVMNAADAGTPLVVSRVLGVEEYVDETSAVLVEPGDPRALRLAVDALLDDPERQQALRRALSERGRGYDMAAYLTRLAEVVTGTAAQARGSGSR